MEEIINTAKDLSPKEMGKVLTYILILQKKKAWKSLHLSEKLTLPLSQVIDKDPELSPSSIDSKDEYEDSSFDPSVTFETLDKELEAYVSNRKSKILKTSKKIGISLPNDIQVDSTFVRKICKTLTWVAKFGEFPIVSDGEKHRKYWLPIFIDYGNFDPEYNRRVRVTVINSHPLEFPIIKTLTAGEGGPSELKEFNEF